MFARIKASAVAYIPSSLQARLTHYKETGFNYLEQAMQNRYLKNFYTGATQPLSHLLETLLTFKKSPATLKVMHRVVMDNLRFIMPVLLYETIKKPSQDQDQLDPLALAINLYMTWSLIGLSIDSMMHNLALAKVVSNVTVKSENFSACQDCGVFSVPLENIKSNAYWIAKQLAIPFAGALPYVGSYAELMVTYQVFGSELLELRLANKCAMHRHELHSVNNAFTAGLGFAPTLLAFTLSRTIAYTTGIDNSFLNRIINNFVLKWCALAIVMQQEKLPSNEKELDYFYYLRKVTDDFLQDGLIWLSHRLKKDKPAAMYKQLKIWLTTGIKFISGKDLTSKEKAITIPSVRMCLELYRDDICSLKAGINNPRVSLVLNMAKILPDFISIKGITKNGINTAQRIINAECTQIILADLEELVRLLDASMASTVEKTYISVSNDEDWLDVREAEEESRMEAVLEAKTSLDPDFEQSLRREIDDTTSVSSQPECEIGDTVAVSSQPECEIDDTVVVSSQSECEIDDAVIVSSQSECEIDDTVIVSPQSERETDGATERFASKSVSPQSAGSATFFKPSPCTLRRSLSESQIDTASSSGSFRRKNG